MTQPEFANGFRFAERYEVREYLGWGTLGDTYKAFDLQANRTVVLRTLAPTFRKRKGLVKRFLAYHKRRVQDRDEALRRVHDYGLYEGVPYAALEFLAGLPLAEVMDARREAGQPFGADEVDSLLEGIGRALARLHEADRHHGNLKPSNVFLLPDRIVLTDGELTEILPAEVFARLQLKLPGAAPFLAPEYLSHPDAVGREADVFGMAALGYWLFTGEPPSTPPTPLRRYREDLPVALDEVFAQGLLDAPEERFPTVNTFLLAFARAIGDEEKAKILQQVVEAEALAEAERMRARKEVAEPPSAHQLPSASPEDEVSVAHLFEDEHIEAPEEAPPAEVVADGSSLATEQHAADAVATPLAEAATMPSRQRPVIAIVGVLLLLLVGGGITGWRLGWFGGSAEPPVKAVRPPVGDERLRRAVQRIVGETEVVAKQVRQLAGAPVTTTSAYHEADDALVRARRALAQEDYAAALELAQKAQSLFDELLVDVKAQEAARKAAEAAKREAERKAAMVKAAGGGKRAPAKPGAPAAVAARGPSCPNDMVLVPAGKFRAGSSPDDLLRDLSEREVAEVAVDAYCIDRYEYPNRKGKRSKVGVSLREAAKLCRAAGKRLCTELEWEKACKGPENLDYPYGSRWDPNRCNTETASGEDRSLAPAGAFPRCRSGYGVYDMSGNVLEWTASRFEQNKKLAIVKGGSYMRPDYAARCAYRYVTAPKTKDPEIGFRCCKEAE